MANQGIRAFARDVFVAKNELRRRNEAYTGPKGNTEFRKDVMAAIMTEHGVTLASAATHYNDAFKFIKEQNADLVSGLGRAEDKKGGRKPKAAAVVALPQEETVALLLESTLLEGASPRLMAEMEELEA